MGRMEVDVSILYFGVRVNTEIERLGEKGPVGGCCLPSWPGVRERPEIGGGAKGVGRVGAGLVCQEPVKYHRSARAQHRLPTTIATIPAPSNRPGKRECGTEVRSYGST